jgi:hypothetical protein
MRAEWSGIAGFIVGWTALIKKQKEPRGMVAGVCVLTTTLGRKTYPPSIGLDWEEALNSAWGCQLTAFKWVENWPIGQK